MLRTNTIYSTQTDVVSNVGHITIYIHSIPNEAIWLCSLVRMCFVMNVKLGWAEGDCSLVSCMAVMMKWQQCCIVALDYYHDTCMAFYINAESVELACVVLSVCIAWLAYIITWPTHPCVTVRREKQMREDYIHCNVHGCKDKKEKDRNDISYHNTLKLWH